MKKIFTLFLATVVCVTTICAGTVNLSWNQPTNTANVSGYRVYYLRTSTGTFTNTNPNMVLGAVTTGLTSTSVAITNLTDGLVRFRVTAYNGSLVNFAESDYSNEVSTNLLNKPSVPVLLRIDSVSASN